MKRSLWIYLLLGGILIHNGWAFPQGHQKLAYEVGVNAQIIPMSALDPQGNPVFDLKAEDLELSVNGKSYPIYLLTLYRFDYREGREEPRELSVSTASKRVIFLFIDLSNSSLQSLARSKEIIGKLIRESSSHDEFALLSYREGPGLKYLGGLDEDKEQLLQKLEKLKLDNLQTYQRKSCVYVGMEGQFYLRSITNLKYALMAVPGPKLFFLMTDRWPSCKDRELNFLIEISQEISQAGTPLNVIYTGQFFNNLDQNALKIMAETSGGKFYFTPEADQMVSTIRKSTAAYYELVFISDDKAADTFEIEVKSKRENVTLHTVKITQRKKNYDRMDSLQKKVFAIDVAAGGLWSRNLASVRKAAYSINWFEKKRNEKHWSIEVDIPKELRNKVVEVFLIRFDDNYQDADIEIYKNIVRWKETLNLSTSGDKKRPYFVMVEPKSAFSIYNHVE